MSSRRLGFTLLELFLVLAIMTLLAALLFPILREAVERGRRTHCLGNLHQLAQAHLLYVEDWDDQLPPWWQWGERHFTFWPEYLSPYLKDSEVFRCRGFTWGDQEPDPGIRMADYSLLTWGPGGTGTLNDPQWRWAGPPMRLSDVRRPAETFSLMDGSTTTQMTRALVGRHSGGANASFLDGHVSWVRLSEAVRIEKTPAGYRYRHISAEGE